MDIRKLQRVIVDGLEDVKAQDILVFNTEHLSPLFERVIIASGTSNRQTKALSSSVRVAVKAAGLEVLRTEGEDNGEWIIVDCGAAVCHIMQPAIRDYYRLEEIWGGKQVKMKLGEAKIGLVKASSAAADEAPAKKKPAAKKATTTAATGAGKAALAKPARAKKAVVEEVEAPRVVKKSTGARKVTTGTTSAAKAAAPVQKAAPAKKAAAAKKAAIKTTAGSKAAPAKKAPAKKAAPIKTIVVKPAAKKTGKKAAPARKTGR
jgi:ribosome-associated protein